MWKLNSPVKGQSCGKRHVMASCMPCTNAMERVAGGVWVICHSLRWRHNGRDSVSNHQPHDCLPNRLFRRRSKTTSKLCVTGLCAGNSPGTGEFPAQMASNTGNVYIWWRHHVVGLFLDLSMALTSIFEWSKNNLLAFITFPSFIKTYINLKHIPQYTIQTCTRWR